MNILKRCALFVFLMACSVAISAIGVFVWDGVGVHFSYSSGLLDKSIGLWMFLGGAVCIVATPVFVVVAFKVLFVKTVNTAYLTL